VRLERLTLEPQGAEPDPGPKQILQGHRLDAFTCAALEALQAVHLRRDSLEDVDSPPPPAMLAAEIVEDLEAALADFAELARSLPGDGDQPG
jgi:type I restriction enzyme M protein